MCEEEDLEDSDMEEHIEVDIDARGKIDLAIMLFGLICRHRRVLQAMSRMCESIFLLPLCRSLEERSCMHPKSTTGRSAYGEPQWKRLWVRQKKFRQFCLLGLILYFWLIVVQSALLLMRYAIGVQSCVDARETTSLSTFCGSVCAVHSVEGD